MIHALPMMRQLQLALALLCLATGALGQDTLQVDEGIDESSGEELSVYDTLVFDSPREIISGRENESLRKEVSTNLSIRDGSDQVEATDILRFQDTISDIESTGGAWDINLTENLSSMGEIYQQRGMHQEAVDSYGRAMHISRVNLGLTSQEHLPFVERMVDSYLALGDWDSADRYHDYLFNALRQEYGLNDPRMVPALRKRASWELSLFNARWGEELGAKLLNALFLYRTASNLVNRYYGPDDQRFSNYLRDTAGAAYLVSRYQALIKEAATGQYRRVQESFVDGSRGLVGNYDDGYRQGLEALQLIVASFPEERRTTVDYAEALLLEADWYLVFDRRRAAEAKYSEAYDLIASLPVEEGSNRSLFSSVLPLPAFSEEIESILTTSNYEGRVAIARDSGYVDVQFAVTRFGEVTDLEVLTDENQVDSRVVSSLRRRIRGTMFRPVIVDGELVRSENNRFRYYYAY